MSKQRNGVLAGIGLVLVAMLVFGGTAAAKPKATTTLRVMMLSSNKPASDIIIANFKRVNPDVEINAEYPLAGPAYTQVIATQFASGQGADVVWLHFADAVNTSTRAFAQAGQLADLSKAPWVKRIPAADRKLVTIGGKTYAWPLGTLQTVVEYNRTFFRQNNLRVPTTFPQLLTLCRRIVSLGKVPFAWGGQNTAINSVAAAALASGTVASKDPEWMAKRKAGRTTFAASPGWRRAIQMIADMKNAGCMGPAPAAVSLPQMLAQFGSGEAIMMLTSANLAAQAKVTFPSLDYGLFPPPADVARDTRLTLQSAGYVGVNRRSSSQTAAKAFVDFLAREKQSRLFAQVTFIVAPFDELKNNIPQAFSDLASFYRTKRTVQALNTFWPNSTMSNDMGASIQGLFTGQKTVDDVLRDMDAAWVKPA